MRHQDATTGHDDVNIDPEKIDWLSKAWDEIFKSCSDLVRNILLMVQDEGVSREQRNGLLGELLELLENIDNAKVMTPLKGWEVLAQLYQSSVQDPETRVLILQVVCAAI